jgi:hypothetical protein
LADREHECCAFFSFEITRRGEHIDWTTKARAEAASVLDEFSRLPETLAAEPERGRDFASLKQRVESAGLTFTADVDPAEDE